MTGRFYLVRHAEAERPEGVADHDRNLSPAGRLAFERFAASLAPSLRIVRILSSPFTRARETALALVAATGSALEEVEALLPGRSTGLELLRLAAGSEAGTALVGHNPEIAEAVALAAGSARSVPPGTIAAVEEVQGGYRLMWVKHP